MEPHEEFINNYLSHEYSSKYYDPVKAHEYYMRTRELKGREKGSTKGLTKRKRETLAVSKYNINANKKSELSKISTNRKNASDMLRSSANTKRQEISNQLEETLLNISASSVNKKKQILDSRKQRLEDLKTKEKQKIYAIPAIPKNVSAARYKILAAERAEKIASIKGESASERDKIISDTSSELGANTLETKWYKATARNDASEKKKQVLSSVKSSIENARSEWKAQKELIQKKYEIEEDKEFERIKRS